MNLRPPGVKARFEDHVARGQAFILAYSQIRELEELEILKMELRCRS